MTPEFDNHRKRHGRDDATLQPNSATQKFRDYFREKLYGHSPQGFVDIKPFPSQIIRTGSRTTSKDHKTSFQAEEVCAAAIRADRDKAKKRRERRPRPPDLDLPFSNTKPRILSSNADSNTSRNASKFSNENDSPVAGMLERRAEISRGKLERVVPPSNSPLREQQAPTRPPPLAWATLSGPVDTPYLSLCEAPPHNHSPALSPRQKFAHVSTIPKTASHLDSTRRSAMSNLASSADLLEEQRRSALSNLALSADLLDETRRAVASAVRRSAEKTVHSLSYHRNGSENYPSDDDDSFYCIGESRPLSLHHREATRSPVSGFTSPIPSSQPNHNSAKVKNTRRLTPNNKDVRFSAEVECRLCKRKYPGELTGLCSNCEEEFSWPATRYVEFSSNEEIKPTPPLKIIREAEKIRPVENRTNLLLPLNSVRKTPNPSSVSYSDRGSPPMVPLPKLPIRDTRVQVDQDDVDPRVRTAAHRSRVGEAPPHKSQEVLVQSVGETVRYLRIEDPVEERTKLESSPTGQLSDPWLAYNNTRVTSLSHEVVPEILSRENLESEEGLGLLARGLRNRERTNSHGEENSFDDEKQRRDTLFYSFYDEILEDAREKPARRRDAG